MKIKETFEKGKGILRLIPVFMPIRFSKAGFRLRLHPDDYYALGPKRGSIKERWLSSVMPHRNDPLAEPDDGLSYVLPFSEKIEEKFTLKETVDVLGKEIVGEELMQNYGGWPMLSKFIDYGVPLFHHLHFGFEAAEKVGRWGKPEAYYYPPEMNNYEGEFPVTYFGFDPDVTKDMVKECLLRYEKGDNRITELSRAYRIELGTGWYTPPGVLHAPGSYLAYEPQWNGDANSVYENIASGEIIPYEYLAGNCPEDRKRNIDYILNLMDWEKNIDPNYKKHYFRRPVQCESSNEKYTEKWITYANDYFGAKELRINPGQTVIVKDQAAYGCIIIQGYGKFGVYDAEAPVIMRYGQPSNDEYFVSEAAAMEGVEIINISRFQPMVILKHFGPNHPQMPTELLNK